MYYSLGAYLYFLYLSKDSECTYIKVLFRLLFFPISLVWIHFLVFCLVFSFSQHYFSLYVLGILGCSLILRVFLLLLLFSFPSPPPPLYPLYPRPFLSFLHPSLSSSVAASMQPPKGSSMELELTLQVLDQRLSCLWFWWESSSASSHLVSQIPRKHSDEVSLASFYGWQLPPPPPQTLVPRLEWDLFCLRYSAVAETPTCLCLFLDPEPSRLWVSAHFIFFMLHRDVYLVFEDNCAL